MSPTLNSGHSAEGISLTRRESRQIRTVGMPLSKEQKRQRRAAAAGPNPRPRGRAPVGANGAEMEWDRERGAWIESALGVVEQHGTAVGDIAVAWEPPLIWDQPRVESGWSDPRCRRRRSRGGARPHGTKPVQVKWGRF